MRILICDDEKQYSDAIRDSIYRWASQRAVTAFSIDIHASSEDMLESLRNRAVYDIAFLDIQFPGEMNGLQIAQQLRLINEQMNIVFISNYEEYAAEGYRVNALRFFYKPVCDDQIFECMDIAYHQRRMQIDSCLVIDNKQQFYRIRYRSILYIESQTHYIHIHSADGKKEVLTFRRKIADVMQKLPDEMFVQCHRSFIVNLLYTKRISRGMIYLTDGTEIPVSPRSSEDVLNRFKNLFQGELL